MKLMILILLCLLSTIAASCSNPCPQEQICDKGVCKSCSSTEILCLDQCIKKCNLPQLFNSSTCKCVTPPAEELSCNHYGSSCSNMCFATINGDQKDQGLACVNGYPKCLQTDTVPVIETSAGSELYFRFHCRNNNPCSPPCDASSTCVGTTGPSLFCCVRNCGSLPYACPAYSQCFNGKCYYSDEISQYQCNTISNNSVKATSFVKHDADPKTELNSTPLFITTITILVAVSVMVVYVKYRNKNVKNTEWSDFVNK
jgi:hypothetical protein